MKRLNPKIVAYLSKKTGKKESTIKKDISLMTRDHGSCTPNAVAQIYARQFRLSVLQKLDREDKSTLPNIQVKKNKVVVNKKQLRKKEKIYKLVDYETDDYFKRAHIQAINKAYTKGCYTSVNILARKIIENLIIDILRAKFPHNKKQNKELYYDTSKRRFKDFSVILKNLYNKRTVFKLDDKDIVERLYSKALKIKNYANDVAHSWFYIVKIKKEIDDLELQTIIELIKKLEKSAGIRT